MTDHPVSNALLRQLATGGAIGQSNLPNVYPVSTTEELAIGREAGCQIILDSTHYSGVSRRHAVVRPLSQAGTWEICDLNSVNGTYVNGDLVQGCQPLQIGDRITLGQGVAEFIFDVPDEPATLVAAESETTLTSTLWGDPLRPIAPTPPSTPSVLTITQMIPILSTGRDLIRKAYLLPAIVTVGVVVLMFATIGNFVAFVLLLAFYLGWAGYYVVYQLCGKPKPWWLLLGSAVTTMLLLDSPLIKVFLVFFREILPGNVFALPKNASFLAHLVVNFFGAGLLEELFKVLPVFALYFLGLLLRSPLRERIGVWEPLDGILLGTASAVGFTLVETLGQYVPNIVEEVTIKSGVGSGQSVGLQLLIPRLLGSVAGHMAYSGHFGYFIGLSVLKPSQRWMILGFGYVTAAGLHAFWNATSRFNLSISAIVGCLSYAFLAAAILKARALSPTRSQNFATRLKR